MRILSQRVRTVTRPMRGLQAAEKAAGLEVGKWTEQDDRDWKVDMQQLEGQMLQAVGGVEGLKEMLSGQAATLQQVAQWLHDMQASSTAITTNLVQVGLQLGHLQGTVEQRFDGVDSMLKAVLAYMASHQHAVPGPQQQQQRQQQQQPRPVFVIPRSEIRFSEADLEQAAGGAFGKVVKAARDHGYVAVKIYRHHGLGYRDRKRVVHEALLLARASHQNVVRCFGVVHDPDNPNDPSNIDGSLVMEWVYGGDLYKWLQANDICSFRERLTLAAQVRLLGLGYVAVGVDTPTHCTAVQHAHVRCVLVQRCRPWQDGMCLCRSAHAPHNLNTSVPQYVSSTLAPQCLHVYG
jgi:hypothetical protein